VWRAFVGRRRCVATACCQLTSTMIMIQSIVMSLWHRMMIVPHRPTFTQITEFQPMTRGFLLTTYIRVVRATNAGTTATQRRVVKTVAQTWVKITSVSEPSCARTTRSIEFISGHWRWLSTLIVRSAVMVCLTLRQRRVVYLMRALWLCPAVAHQVKHTQVMHEVFADEMCDVIAVVLRCPY